MMEARNGKAPQSKNLGEFSSLARNIRLPFFSGLFGKKSELRFLSISEPCVYGENSSLTKWKFLALPCVLSLVV
jgi:hypothetical protein